MLSFRIVGPGRAGTSLAAALSARGWAFAGFLGRHDDLSGAARGVDVLVLTTPDDAIAEVAATVAPVGTTTVVHLSGSLGLDVLDPHPLRAAVHPLVPLPNDEVGAARLRSGVTFAVAGAPVAHAMVEALGGRLVEVADGDRAAYHAAACIAANHVVALLGQVERVAASVGLDLESFLPLTRAAVDDVDALGAAAALTGPARRGDWATLSRHLDALPEGERTGYQAGRRRWRPGWPARPYPAAVLAAMDVVETQRAPGGPGSMRPGPSAGPSASCPPWGRSTTGTCRSWRGPGPSATWWR